MTALSISRTLLACIALVDGGANAAVASGFGLPVAPGLGSAFGGSAEELHEAPPMRLAQADCSAAAAQAAAQTGGQVLSVSASSQGGQTVCVVTVLIPGQGGERPRRTTITVPG